MRREGEEEGLDLIRERIQRRKARIFKKIPLII